MRLDLDLARRIVLVSAGAAVGGVRTPAVDTVGYGFVGFGVEGWGRSLDIRRTMMGWHSIVVAAVGKSVAVGTGRPWGCTLLGSCVGSMVVVGWRRSLLLVTCRCRLDRLRMGSRWRWTEGIGL